MEWLPVMPELDPPDTVVPLPDTAIHLGWRRDLGIDWRLDVVLSDALFGTHRRVVPAVVVSPMLRLPLDVARVRQAFDAWATEVLGMGGRAERVDALAVPPVEDVLLTPLSGPRRTCDPLRPVNDYWDNRHNILSQAALALDQLDRKEGPELEDLISDYPFITATLPSAKRLWDRRRPHTPPSRVDSVDRIKTRRRRGRPRRAMPPHLAAELDAVLPDGRGLRSEEWDARSRLLGPLKARWAVQTALDLDGESDDPHVLEVMRWFAKQQDPDSDDSLEIAARRMVKYSENRTSQLLQGRWIRSGLYDVRRIAPYICPDLSVYPRPLCEQILRDQGATDDLLLDWLRSDAFVRMVQIVSGRDLASVSTRAKDGTLEGLLSERHLPFRRLSVRFNTDDEAHRGVAAMVPGADPCHPIELDLTGFGVTVDELRERWL